MGRYSCLNRSGLTVGLRVAVDVDGLEANHLS
jgi:hypothetical protein